MKKMIIMLSFLIGFNANAGLITIDLSSNNVNAGETITVDLKASNFSSFDTFDFDFAFDNNLFSFQAGSFTSDLLTAFPFFFEATENGNGLAISYLDFFPVLDTDFLLASFKLVAISAGTSNFSLDNVMFYDGVTQASIDSTASSSATINQVPEPATLLLLVLALLFVGRKQFSHKQF